VPERYPRHPRESEITEEQFRKILNVPPQHQLRCTDYVLMGMDDWEWTHEERDGQGNLIARYTTSLHIGFSSTSGTQFRPGPDGIVERTFELRRSDIELWEAMAATQKGGNRL
jgi:hypothetical protein